MESMGNLRRTHYVGALRAKDAGTEMTVAGSIAKCRDKGGVIFADLRDNTGILQLIFDDSTSAVDTATEAQIRSGLDGVNAVAAVYALHEMFFARIIGCGHQVNTCLIYGHRIEGSQYADILHAWILCDLTAVAVHGQILHYIDKGYPVPEMFCYAACGICHGLWKDHIAGMLLPCPETVVSLAGRVYQRFSCP